MGYRDPERQLHIVMSSIRFPDACSRPAGVWRPRLPLPDETQAGIRADRNASAHSRSWRACNAQRLHKRSAFPRMRDEDRPDPRFPIRRCLATPLRHRPAR